MKAVTLVAVLSLALSVSAAGQTQQNNNFRFRGGQNGQNTNNRGSNTGKNNGGASASSAAASSAVTASSSVAASAAAVASASATISAAAAGNTSTSTAANSNTGDPQTSLTLDPKVIATGFANNSQDVPEAGQVMSLTSTNNFINFCLTVPNLPITNGKQITTGSCNPVPMGVIPSTDNMPSAKFQNPKNGNTITENTAFTVTMAISNFQSGAFTNAQQNYFAAPQQVNGAGQIIGHSHIVIETLSALDQTTPTDPKKFAYFKGLNTAAVNGVLTADVSKGLPAGFYRLASINTAANHQPVLVPITQHGSLDDAVYFTVSAGAASTAQASAIAFGAATASISATPAASSSASKLSAVSAPGTHVVPPAKNANPKRIKQSSPCQFY